MVDQIADSDAFVWNKRNQSLLANNNWWQAEPWEPDVLYEIGRFVSICYRHSHQPRL